MIKWLLFDLGSTLLDEEEAYKRYTKNCVRKLRVLGIDLSVEVYWKKMEECACKGLDPIRDTWHAVAPNEKRPLWTNEGVRLYPETKEVLEKLSSRYSLGIIANQSSDARDLLKEWGLLSYLQLIILSEEVGVAKPNPILFSYALEKIAVPAKQVVYVGDRYDNDIVPANSLGIKTVRVMHGLGKWMIEDEDSRSDYTISSLKELLKLHI